MNMLDNLNPLKPFRKAVKLQAMPHDEPDSTINIIGISELGWNSLGDAARHHISQSGLILGGQRQLELLPHDITKGKKLQTWPSPLIPFLERFAKNAIDASLPQPKTCILASGNPMLYGIGASLSRLLPPDMLTVLPQPSIQSLVCARMLWPQQDTTLISLCGRPLSQLNSALFDKNRIIILGNDNTTPSQVAQLLLDKDFPFSTVFVFEDIGSKSETMTEFFPADLCDKTNFSSLNAIAVQLDFDQTKIRTYPENANIFGLPDTAFLHNGQITKQEVRTLTLAALSPRPHEILWDIGAGSGSVSIEWLRAAPQSSGFAIEPRADRIDNIKENVTKLSRPTALTIIQDKAPECLKDLPRPHAIFIGGGLTHHADLIPTCLIALQTGGRLVINAVTLQSEAILYKAYQTYGGSLTHIQISKPDKIGSFDSWKPARPVTQWHYIKPYYERPTNNNHIPSSVKF